jgi:hypothetical protein
VYFDPISGEHTEEKTIYAVRGKIVAPGMVEVKKPVVKTSVVRGRIPLGKKIAVYVDGEKTSLKRTKETDVKVPGTVVDVKDGVSTLSYIMPSGPSKGQYVQRYSPTNITGQFVTDPRYIRRISPDAQRQIAEYKPPELPLCDGQDFHPRDPQNCFIQGMKQRLAPIIADIRKYQGTAGSGASNPFCDLNFKKIQAHQIGVYEFARILASRSPKQTDGIRGMLCFHSVGLTYRS